MFAAIIAICLGACAGALLRWAASALLNPVLTAFPLGTLAVNWLGGLLMGIALGYVAAFPGVSPESRLLIITGFLGSLTTFSTFAGEMAALIQQGKLLLCLAVIGLHVFGSIGMVFLGLCLFRWVKQQF